MKRYAVPILACLGSVGFVVTLWLVFVETPPDRVLFFNQKIFYYHVGHAFMLFAAVGIAGICSIVYLAKHDPKWDDVALAAAEVAVAFGIAVLITGSIWAKAAWDLWWTWSEKRLTMSLLLWLTLVGYVLVRRFAGHTADRIAAGLAIFAMVGVPFIYTMVDKGDLHPQNNNVPGLDPAMKPAFWLSVATMGLWFSALVISRVQSARAERELRELRERGLDAGILT
jgi:heme exporter protein C